MPTAPVTTQPQGSQPARVAVYPVVLGDDSPSPLQFTDNPQQTDWASPSTTAAGVESETPNDSFPGLANNPNIPGPWNRTTQQQAPGVDYNHDNNDTVQTNGVGYLGWITEWQNNMGGLGNDFLATQEVPDGRYQGAPMDDSEGNLAYVVWTEPLDGTTKDNPLLTKFIPFLGLG
jgi:hypothetical protein